jgi:DNA-binding NarL/FixJ family response regulator
LLTKDAGRSEIAMAVRAAAAGQTLPAPDVHERLLAAARPSQPRRLPDGLTAREADVLRLIAAGLTNARIAAELVITEATVTSHINHIFAKTGVRDRAHAVHYAYEHGLVAERST